jgi:TP901 family phage tail tape measure protein
MDANALEIVVTLVNEAEAGMLALQAQLDELKKKGDGANTSTKSLGNSFKDVGGSLSAIGANMSKFVTRPILGAGVAAIDLSIKFEQSMTLLQTQAGMSAADVKKLSGQVLELAKTSAFTPEQLSQGLYHLASVGMDATSSINALTAAQKLAATGNANMEDSTQAVTIAWKSGISGASDFNDAVASINAIVGAGDMRMQQLNTSLGTSGLESTARSAGISFSDMGATLALMTDMTGNADVSAQHLRTAFLMMEAPSGQAAKALASIGIGSKQLGVDLQEGGVPKALQDIKSHLTNTFGPTAITTLKTYQDVLAKDGAAAADKFANSSENAASVIGKAFGGSKSSATVMQLVSNLDALGQKEEQIKTGASKFNADYAATTETAAFKVKNAWADIQANLIQLGSQALPVVSQALKGFVDGLEKVSYWFEHLSPVQRKMALGFVVMIAAVGPLLGLLGTLFGIIGGIMLVGAGVALAVSGIVVAVIALGIAAVYVITHWTQVKTFFSTLWSEMMSGVTTAVSAIGKSFEYLGTHFFEIIGFMYGFWETLPIKMFMVMSQGMDRLTNWLSHIDWQGVFMGMVWGIVSAVAQMMTAVGNAYNWIHNLPWGQAMTGIGKGIGNAIVDMIQGAINGAFSGIPGVPKINLPHFANGVQNFSGGMAVVGDGGEPEIVNLPAGSSVTPLSAIPLTGGGSHTTNNSQSVTIGQIVLATAPAVDRFFSQLDQDAINVGRGLTAARGSA